MVKVSRNANPLALVATAQADRDPYYQTSRSHRSSAPSPKPLIPSRTHTTTRHKGKEIAKRITPPSETAFEEDSDHEQAQMDKDMQKNLALIAKYFKKIYKPTNKKLRTSSNSKNKNVDTTLRFKKDNQSGQFGNQRMVNVVAVRENVGSKVVQQSGIQCFNCKEYGHFAKECRKPKRVKDSAYHKEKMLLCKQAEQGVPLQAEQYDWLADTDEKTKQAEFEKFKAFNDRTIDYDKFKHKLNDALGQLAHKDTIIREERLARNANPLVLFATAQADRDPYYQTSRSHRSYAPSPKPSIPSRTHTTTRHKGKEIAKQITPPSETASEEDNDHEQAQRDKDMQKNLALIPKYFKKIYKPTNKNLRTSSNSKNKNVDTTLRFKKDNQSGRFGNRRTVNVVAVRENVGSKVVQQSGIQCFNCKEYGHFAKECRKPKRVKDSAYHKEKMLLCKQAEQGVSLQAEQYDWLADTDEEVDEQELEAHYSYMAKIQEVPTADSGTNLEPVEYVQNDAGYNVFANHLQHSKQSESVSNTCLVETDDSNVIPDSPDILILDGEETLALKRKNRSILNKDLVRPYDYTTLNNLYEIFKPATQEYETQLAHANEIRRKIWRKSFVKSKPNIYKNTKLVPKANVSEGLSKPVTAQTLPQTAKKAVSNTNVLKPRMYRIDNRTAHMRAPQLPQTVRNANPRVSTSTEVNHKPNVSRPQLKSNQSKDKVLSNDSQVKGKKTQVEVHPRIPSVSNKMKSVTAYKDNLNSRTLNANVVCATCNKCLIDSNHFACVTKMLNDVHARTKKPNVVPISTRKPKSQANKSMATPNKKKVAS
nr:hypothetical protein [Tanacetum cinerariifolium]